MDVEHDPDFAARYLREKEEILQAMQTAFYDRADAGDGSAVENAVEGAASA